MSFFKQVEQTRITIAPPLAKFNCWDMRTFGICNYGHMLDFAPLADHADAFRRGESDGRMTVGESDKDCVVVMTLISSRGLDKDNPKAIDGKAKFWIDTRRGFVPIRMEAQDIDLKGSVGGKTKWLPPSVISQANWKLQDDVWVPKSAIVELIVPEPSGSTFSIRHDLTFEWHSVNPELNESDFALEHSMFR